MKLLLTSFTMGWSIFKWYSVPERIDGIPPLAFREYSTEFFPDLSDLLFCKKLIMDESTYFLFTTPECALYSKEYCRVFKALKNEGLLELKNYSDDLTKNRDLLLKMLQRDLKHLDVWVPALRKSCEIWKRVLQRATQDDELINLKIMEFKQIGNGLLVHYKMVK